MLKSSHTRCGIIYTRVRENSSIYNLPPQKRRVFKKLCCKKTHLWESGSQQRLQPIESNQQVKLSCIYSRIKVSLPQRERDRLYKLRVSVLTLRARKTSRWFPSARAVCLPGVKKLRLYSNSTCRFSDFYAFAKRRYCEPMACHPRFDWWGCFAAFITSTQIMYMQAGVHFVYAC